MSDNEYPGKCRHQKRLWHPLEGTISGAVLFDSDPGKHGICEVCEAATRVRSACVSIVEGSLSSGHLQKLHFADRLGVTNLLRRLAKEVGKAAL